MLIRCNVLLTDKPLFTRLLHDVIACNSNNNQTTAVYPHLSEHFEYMAARIIHTGNDCLIRVFCLRFMLDGVLYASKVHGYWNLDTFISNDADSY